MKIRFLGIAFLEFKKAAKWYVNQKEGLGDLFKQAIDQKIQSIAKFPKGFPICNNGFRKAILGRFPYVIFYQVKGDWIEIVAIFHTSRDPDGIQGR